jgi:hypothetical protein
MEKYKNTKYKMENKNNKCGLRRIELLKKKYIKWKI